MKTRDKITLRPLTERLNLLEVMPANLIVAPLYVPPTVATSGPSTPVRFGIPIMREGFITTTGSLQPSK
jgi:hypothetical protein